MREPVDYFLSPGKNCDNCYSTGKNPNKFSAEKYIEYKQVSHSKPILNLFKTMMDQMTF